MFFSLSLWVFLNFPRLLSRKSGAAYRARLHIMSLRPFYCYLPCLLYQKAHAIHRRKFTQRQRFICLHLFLLPPSLTVSPTHIFTSFWFPLYVSPHLYLSLSVCWCCNIRLLPYGFHVRLQIYTRSSISGWKPPTLHPQTFWQKVSRKQLSVDLQSLR